MDLSSRFCDLCRDTAIDLDALRAYYQSGDTTARTIRCPDRRDLAGKKPPFFRFAEQFSLDCPLCQIIWNAVGHDTETPVAAIQLQAEQDLPRSFDQFAKRVALSPIRNVSSWFGYRGYYPCSLLNVVSWHCEQGDSEFPEGFSMGGVGQLRVFTDPESPSSLKRYIAGRSICPPDSGLNTGRILRWLETCVKSHEKCRRGLSGSRFGRQEETILPSRVVDVGLSGSSQARLVKPGGGRGRYCALSYCWAPPASNHEKTTLLKETESQFQHGLPVEDLPQPIQDAMEVTRRLGVPYLWVDRLCIIQDDKEDTKAECDRMCDIYERAFVTLSALGDDTGGKGLFLDRDILDYPVEISQHVEIESQPPRRVRLPCTVKDKRRGDVYLGRVSSSDTSQDGSSCFDQELEASRWITRGWILQERLLSRRIVHFGKRQIYWECQTAFCNEDGTPSEPDSFHSQTVGLLKQKFLEDLTVDDFLARFRLGTVQIHDLWAELVEHYSTRNLTYGTDKLRAISGVAEALKRRFSLNRFHHGLWTDYLSEQLAWYAKGSLTRRQDPSWSWASWDGEVKYRINLTFNARLYITESQVMDVPTKPTLWLGCGMLAQAYAQRIDADIPEEFSGWLDTVTSISSSKYSVWPWLMRSRDRFDAFLTVTGRPVGVVKYDNPSESASGSCTCLLLSRDNEPWENRLVYCFTLVVLEKIEDGPPGTANKFRRIGLAEAVNVPDANIGFPFDEVPETELHIV